MCVPVMGTCVCVEVHVCLYMWCVCCWGVCVECTCVGMCVVRKGDQLQGGLCWWPHGQMPGRGPKGLAESAGRGASRRGWWGRQRWVCPETGRQGIELRTQQRVGVILDVFVRVVLNDSNWWTLRKAECSP